jgi:hypothetical protein
LYDWDSVVHSINAQGFWFVDVPRTSSSSLRSELGTHFGPVNGKTNIFESSFALDRMLLPAHMPAKILKRKVGPVNWAKLFKFSIVRNPWDRILSLYYYMKKAKTLPDSWTFAEFVRRLEHADAHTPRFGFRGFRFGATDFLTNADGRLLVDKVVKYENRREGLSEIAERIGLPELGLLNLQKAKPSTMHYSDAYTAELRQIIARRYASDVDLFEYSFEDRSP